jgi:hypothetical protein
MNMHVRKYLIEVARQKDKFVYYGDVVKECKLNINLSIPSDHDVLSNILSEVSTYEHDNGRPLLTSLVIYKDSSKNDHGEGFYKLAQSLGLGDKKKLRNELFGFSEATKCREFWQDENNYSQFAVIETKPTKRLLPIKQLFTELIIDKPYEWLDGWKGNCLSTVKDVSLLRKNLLANSGLSIDDISLYQNLSNANNRTYEGFMRKWLKERDNGIASRGQSVLSEIDFKTIIHDNQFKIIAQQVILNPSLETYNLFTSWWYNNENISNRPLLINRALAACNPEQISTTAHSTKFWDVFNRLQADYNFTLTENHNWNWYFANEQLTKWLDNQLFEELNSITQEILEQHIWRNIFIWVLYEERETLQNVKPNSLKRIEKPKNGITEIPKAKRNFKGVDVDFQAQAKEQKDLGDDGEELVKQFEIDYLKGKDLNELAAKVEIMKDGVGYDILSFNIDGSEKYIEVKTTKGNKFTPFFLSDNEFDFLKQNIDKYSIYRVFNYNADYNFAEFYEIKGNIEMQLLMKPINYKVFLKKESL